MTEQHKCQCSVCIAAHRFFEIIKSLSPENQNWMETFYENHCNAMMDANVNQAIIDGAWPRSDDIIQLRRKNLREKNGNTKR